MFDKEFVRELARAVADELRKEFSPGSETVYSTRKAGPHIPGKSRSWMLENIKRMTGSRKVGRDWTISSEAYEAWLEDRDIQRAKVKPEVTSASTMADAYLERAGLRVPRVA